MARRRRHAVARGQVRRNGLLHLGQTRRGRVGVKGHRIHVQKLQHGFAHQIGRRHRRVADREIEHVLGADLGLARHPVGKQLTDGARLIAQPVHLLVDHDSPFAHSRQPPRADWPPLALSSVGFSVPPQDTTTAPSPRLASAEPTTAAPSWTIFSCKSGWARNAKARPSCSRTKYPSRSSPRKSARAVP